jgi:hypothetical protein
LPAASSPPEATVVPPKYVLAPLKINVPLPTLVIEPAPEINPEKVVLVLSEPMLKASLPVARKTPPLPDKEPMVSAALLDKENVAPASTIIPDESLKVPFPTNLKVPAWIVVVPPKVLTPAVAKTPDPFFSRLVVVPEIDPV